MTAPYCRDCATPLVEKAITGKNRHQCPACGFVQWRNPAPVGMALIRQGDGLVLIRRRDAPLAGYWAPPAGYVECGESVPEAVTREASEECGLAIELDGLLGVYSQADVDVLLIVYHARTVGGELVAGDDAADARVFALDELPQQLSPPGGTATEIWFHAAITDCLARWREAIPKENSA